jgi:DNA-binding transcriptional LysR family regulator
LNPKSGTPLLTRSGRTVQPTPAAASILLLARNVQREVQDLKSIATGGVLSGELRLGATPTLICGLVPDVLYRFAKVYPQIDVRISRNNSTELYAKLMDGEIDAAFTSHPSFALPKTCGWKLLREEPFVVLTPRSMRPRHPHAILSSEPFIRLDRKVYAGQMIDDYLRKAGIHPNERLEMDGPEAIAVMVDRGLGVSLLPDWPPPWPEGLKLRKIALPDHACVRRIGLLWLRASLRSGLIRALLQETVKNWGL